MLNERRNVRLTSLFMITFQSFFPTEISIGKMPVNRQAGFLRSFQPTGEYRLSVRGKTRTPAGIFASVQGWEDDSTWSAFIPYTARLSSLSGLITVPLSSRPANRPLLRE